MAGVIVSLLSGVTTSIGAPPVAATPGIVGPFRPPQWSNPNSVPPFTMTGTDPANGQKTVYVFDVIIHAEHQQVCEITHNPVQTGAAISDHAYIQPARLSIEIRMSDSMDSYTVGQWAGAASKSVNAYQKLVALQQALGPVQIATRLATYANMIITNIIADDSQETAFGLKAYITFTQLITATISITADSGAANPTSAIPQVTQANQIGPTNPNPVPQSIQKAYNVGNGPIDGVNPATVPGAGNWSSYNVSNLSDVTTL